MHCEAYTNRTPLHNRKPELASCCLDWLVRNSDLLAA